MHKKTFQVAASDKNEDFFYIFSVFLCIIDSRLPAIHKHKSGAVCCGVLEWNVNAAACTQTEGFVFFLVFLGFFLLAVRVNGLCLGFHLFYTQFEEQL